MSFEQAFQTFLDSNLIDVGFITANLAPQGETKGIMYQKISTMRDREIDHDGTMNLKAVNFQFNFYAEKKSKAVEMRDQLQQVLADYNGQMGDYRVQGAYITDERDYFDSEARVFRESVDYRIQYKE